MSLLNRKNPFTTTQRLLLSLGGLVIFVAVWWFLAEALSRERPVIEYESRPPSSIIGDSTSLAFNRDSLLLVDSINYENATEFETVYPLLPPPNRVVASYPELIQQDDLVSNTALSIWRNLQGYFWAVFLSLIFGFIIGLVPALRAMFSQQVDALRYLPLTALTGLFIIWFGIGDTMKIAFLAFGILVYLLPIVMQRVGEVEDVYLKTAFTLGATDWQLVRTVYFPSVLGKLIDDIRVLTAISWTYIIIAELLNRQGGVGALIYIKARQGQIAKVFAILLVIILVGFLQDRLFVYIDKRLFPHKYYKTTFTGLSEVRYGLLIILGSTMLYLILSVLVAPLAVFGTALVIITLACVLMILYGEFRFQKSYVA